MKISITVVCVLQLVFSLQADSQGKVIDEETYTERIQKATRFRVTYPYRVTEVSESCKTKDECGWNPMHVVVTEVERPGRVHSRITSTGLGETIPSTEFISIDDKTYSKRRGIGWSLETPPTGSLGVPTKVESSRIEYRDLGTQDLSGTETTVLLRTAYMRLSHGSEITESVQTIRSWINAVGNLVKEERLIRNSKIGATRMTSSYMIDPSIRIYAPIE